MMMLRPYQTAAVDALLAGWQQTRSNLVVLPTGTGKSLVQAEIIRRLASGSGAIRILAATHVRELIAQNEAALLRLWPDAPVGVYSAGLHRREGDRQIVFGSIASLKDPTVIGPRSIVLIDEAHLISHEGETTYGKLLASLRAQCPGLLVAGFTATPFRLSTGALTEPFRDSPPVFDRVVSEARLADMIAQGWLAPLTSKATATSYNLRGVQCRGGEYIAADVQRRVNTDPLNEAVVAQTLAMAGDRQSWLMFASGREHAIALADVMADIGIAAGVVLGDTHSAERDELIAAFKARRLRALVSVGVLTTGFDAPNVDCIVLARPTKSPGLYVQMLGRGTRLADGKTNCLVLDFAGNVKRLGPVDEIDGCDAASGLLKGPKERARECRACHTLNSLRRNACIECGEPLKVARPVSIDGGLTGGAVVAAEAEHRVFDVTAVRVERFEKPGRGPVLRVVYRCRDVKFPISSFVHVESEAARRHVARWWQVNARGPVPLTVGDALERAGDIRCPRQIRCRLDGKFWNPVEAIFASRCADAA